MRRILETLIAHLEKDEQAVIGAIIRSSGSVPRSSGARMLVTTDGTLHGTVGGGAVEGQCEKAARKMLETNEDFKIEEFSMTASDAADAGMVCGGAVSVLLLKVRPELLAMMQRLQVAYLAAQKPVLVTVIPKENAVPHMVIADEDTNDSIIPNNILESINRKPRREPFLLQENTTGFFVEPLIHPGVVHLVGAGHVAHATAKLAAFAGFEVVVMDDRQEFANTTRFPEAREVRVLDNFDNCITNMGADDYVVIVTRGHMHDRDVLEQTLRTDAGYIGMIGSSKKQKAVYTSLLHKGISETDLQRVHNPIGLPIGADTPEEIGISIVAELVKIRAGISE